MKTELVNLVTKDGAQTVVLLSTDLQQLTSLEKAHALEVSLWLIDEGWTVATATDSPLAEVVRHAARALAGTYIPLPDDQRIRVTPSSHRMPPQSRLTGGLR